MRSGRTGKKFCLIRRGDRLFPPTDAYTRLPTTGEYMWTSNSSLINSILPRSPPIVDARTTDSTRRQSSICRRFDESENTEVKSISRTTRLVVIGRPVCVRFFYTQRSRSAHFRLKFPPLRYDLRLPLDGQGFIRPVTGSTVASSLH